MTGVFHHFDIYQISYWVSIWVPDWRGSGLFLLKVPVFFAFVRLRKPSRLFYACVHKHTSSPSHLIVYFALYDGGLVCIYFTPPSLHTTQASLPLLLMFFTRRD